MFSLLWYFLMLCFRFRVPFSFCFCFCRLNDFVLGCCPAGNINVPEDVAVSGNAAHATPTQQHLRTASRLSKVRVVHELKTTKYEGFSGVMTGLRVGSGDFQSIAGRVRGFSNPTGLPDPTRPDPTRPDPTRPDPIQPARSDPTRQEPWKRHVGCEIVSSKLLFSSRVLHFDRHATGCVFLHEGYTMSVTPLSATVLASS